VIAPTSTTSSSLVTVLVPVGKNVSPPGATRETSQPAHATAVASSFVSVYSTSSAASPLRALNRLLTFTLAR
jgi:hypothetical protein